VLKILGYQDGKRLIGYRILLLGEACRVAKIKK